MPFTASASATSGLTAYSLEKPAKYLDPNSAGVVFARSFERWFGKKRKAARAAEVSREVKKMSTEQISYPEAVQILEGTLHKAFEAPADQQKELVMKTVGEFVAFTDATAAGARLEAFQDGLDRNFAKFAGFDDEDSLRKGMADVASFAALLDQGEHLCKRWTGADGQLVSPWGYKPPSEGLAKAVGDWIEAGKMLLRRTVEDCMDAPAVEKADMDATYGAPANPEQLAKAAGALRDAVARFTAGGARLAKAEGEAGGEMSDQEIGQMDPIEAMGRLAAGIVMIADQMMGGAGEGGEEEPPEDVEEMAEKGSEAEGEGAAPPPAKGEGVTGETNTREGEREPPPPPRREEGGEAEGGERRPPPRREEEDVEKSDAAGALAKFEQRFSALEAENAALKQHLAKLGSGPAPTKGALRVVEKTADGTMTKADGTTVDIQAEADRLEKLAPEDRTRELVRLSHSNPILKIG